MKRPPVLVSVLLLLLSACGSGSSGDANSVSPLPDVSKSDPQNPGGGASTFSRDVLIFNGVGVATSDWQNTEKIVAAEGWSYSLINSSEMNAMSLDEIATHRLIVVPGGKGSTITANLTPEARLRIRRAVRERGVGYVGFCAGAWVAVGPEADTSSVASYGLAVAKGAVLPSYWPGGNTSLTAAMVKVTFADQTSRQLVWWGGPSTPEWTGGVVARYPTGAPAISQAWAGRGLVVISGPHPEAPQSWRSTAGYDSDGLDYEVAIDMMTAAMQGRPLAAY